MALSHLHKKPNQQSPRKIVPPTPPKPKKPPRPDCGRLPDGAKFEATYNAREQLWTGSLKIGDWHYQSSMSGIFKFFASLDALYRESLQPEKISQPLLTDQPPKD